MVVLVVSNCNLVDIVALALVVDHLVDVSVPVVALIPRRRQQRKKLPFGNCLNWGDPPAQHDFDNF